MNGEGDDGREQLLARLVALQQVHAVAHAQEQRILAELAAWPLPACLDSVDKQYVIDEIAAVLRLSCRTAGYRVATAVDLVERFPATLAALERGELTLEHARALSEETLGLDAAVAGQVEARVLQRAVDTTPAQWRACARRAVACLDRQAVQARPDPRDARRVCARYRADGMAELWALLAAEDAATLMALLTAHAPLRRGCSAASCIPFRPSADDGDRSRARTRSSRACPTAPVSCRAPGSGSPIPRCCRTHTGVRVAAPKETSKRWHQIETLVSLDRSAAGGIR